MCTVAVEMYLSLQLVVVLMNLLLVAAQGEYKLIHNVCVAKLIQCHNVCVAKLIQCHNVCVAKLIQCHNVCVYLQTVL